VISVADKLTQRQVSLKELLYPSVSIIPQMLRPQKFIHHRHCGIVALKVLVNNAFYSNNKSQQDALFLKCIMKKSSLSK
jgi:hypothetical protein